MPDVSSSKSPRRQCPDCGPAGVASHAVERWSVRADEAIGLLQLPMAAIWRMTRPAVSATRPGRITPSAARLAAAMGLGIIVEHPDKENTAHATVLWREAERRGIAMREFRPFGLPRELFWASYGNDTRGFDGLPRPRAASDRALDWMDDKGIILKRFRNAGVPVPRGESCTTLAQAERAFDAIARGGRAAIVKPSIGSRSRHTFTNITGADALRRAFRSAKQLSPRAIVEEEIPGFVFRVTFVNGRVEGIMRREPPHVIGDGAHTVRELVDRENAHPLRRGPVFSPIVFGDEANAMLGAQRLTPDSIPEAGRMVPLHPKVSRLYGASTTEIAFADVHSDNSAMFKTIAEAVDDPLFGVDIIMEDMARSWRSQACGVIECNSLPAIDVHHDPLRGTPRNAAGAVWNMIFPASDPRA